MHAFAGESVQINCKRGNKGLTFTRSHFGDAAFMQHHAADQLHIEMALAEHTTSCFAHGGERWNQNLIERLALRKLVAEFLGLGAQLIIRELLHLGFERIDGGHRRAIGFQPALIGRAEDFLGECAEHRRPFKFWEAGRNGPSGPEAAKREPRKGRTAFGRCIPEALT